MKTSDITCISGALILSLVFIFLSWSSPFISDDYIHIVNSLVLRRIPTISEFLGTGWNDFGATWAYRPILQAISAIEIKIWGYNPGPMRCLNLFLHFINAFLIYKIAESKKILGPWIIAGIIVFILHPIVWHSIIYVSARSSILVTSFVLLSVFFYSKKSNWRFLFLFSGILGALCKETGLLACPIALILNWENTRSDLKNLFLMKNWKYFLLVIMTFLVIVYIRREMFLAYLYNNLNSNFEYEHPWTSYFLAEWKALWIYMRLIIFPAGAWSFFHDIQLDDAVIKLSTWLIAFVTMIVLCLGMIFLFIKKQKYFPWALAIFICFIPEMIFPRQLLLNEQRLYLPIAIITLLFGLFSISNTFLKYGLICFIAFLAWTSMDRVQVYKSEESILEHDISRYAGNRFALPMLAELNLKQGHLEISARLFKQNIDAQMLRSQLGKFEKLELVKSYIQMMRLFISNDQLGLASEAILTCRRSPLITQAYCDWFQVMLWNHEKKYQASLDLINSVKYSLPMLNLEHFFTLLSLNRDTEAKKLAQELKLQFINDEGYALAFIQLLIKRNEIPEALSLWHFFANANPESSGVFSNEFWNLGDRLQRLGVQSQ